MDNIEYNKELCKRYPFLQITDCWTGQPYEDEDYSSTWLDDMPDGWRKAFGKEMLEEIREELIRCDYLNEYRIMQIKEKFPDALMLFVIPPSIEVLLKRLRARGTESEEVIMRRITQAKTECTYMDRYEYIVINDDLDTAVKEMYAMVQSAKFTVSRRREFIDTVIDELKSI